MGQLGPTHLKPVANSVAVIVASIYLRLLHAPAAAWPEIQAKLALVSKSSTDTSCHSWRPLSVLPVVWRLLITLNNFRMRSCRVHDVPAYAFGYCPGVGAADLLVALLTILRRRAEFRLPVAIMKVDMRKAFDTMRRQAATTTLLTRGAPSDAARFAMLSMHQQTLTLVHPTQGSTTTFQAFEGLPQGRSDSPPCSAPRWQTLYDNPGPLAKQRG
jgi:hypothetical protein